MWVELIFGTVFVSTLWFLRCNNVTCKERHAIINQCSAEACEMIKSGDYIAYLKAYSRFENVSYDKHLWYRFTFRDPHPLYLANPHESVLSVRHD